MNLIHSKEIKQLIDVFKKLDNKISESDVEKERYISLEVEIIQIIEKLFKFPVGLPKNPFDLSFLIEIKIQNSIKLGIEVIKLWSPQMHDEYNKLSEIHYSCTPKSDIKHIPKL